MAKFSEYEQKEILGSRHKLAEFQRGEDIERMFNRLRPKYPIRRYIDIYGKMNEELAKGSDLEKYFHNIETKIKKRLNNLTLDNFAKLWNSEENFNKHVEKRVKKGHIKNAQEYLENIKKTFFEPDAIFLKRFDDKLKKEYNRLDRVFYKKGNWWVDIFLENGKIATAFKIEKDWKEILYKGDRRRFTIYKIKRMENGYEIKKDD